MEKKNKPLYWIFAKSFTDPNSYKHFVSEKLSRAFLYIALLTLLLSLIFSTYFIISVDPYVTELISQLSAKTPPFEIENGILETQAKQPLVLTETADKGTLIIIDTEFSGSVTKYEEYETVIILGSEDIYLSNSNIRYSINYKTILSSQKLTSKDFLELVTGSRPGMYISLYIIMFIMFLFEYLFHTLLIALIVRLVRRLRKKQTDLRIAIQLSAYAITLPAILYTLWMFTALNIVFGDFVFILLAYVIAWNGIGAYYKQTQPDLKDKDKLV